MYLDFIRQLAIILQSHLSLKESVSKVSDFPSQDHPDTFRQALFHNFADFTLRKIWQELQGYR